MNWFMFVFISVNTLLYPYLCVKCLLICACMCIREFTMGSYVQYMIIISLLILKQFIFFFSERSCHFLPKHRYIFRNLKLWSLSDKTSYTFFNLSCNESRAQGYKALISWYIIFPRGIAFITHCE